MRSKQHLRAEHVAERGNEAAGPEALAGGVAQLGLQRHRPPQGLQLARDQPLVDDVGDVDEAHVTPEHDQRQVVRAAGGHEHVGRRVGGLEADPGGARAGDGGDQRLDLGGRHAGEADPVVSRNSPPRSTSLTAGVSNTCTHSTRLPSRWPPAATVTSPERNSSRASRSATVRTDCPDSGEFMDIV